MDVATLEAQAESLILSTFTEEDALALGMSIVEWARIASLPIVVNIRTPDRTLFHAALPGSAPNNDNWARRKSNTTLLFQQASLLVGTRLRARGETLAMQGLDPQDYADHGGSLPIRVRGVGVVAAVTVSGLPQVEDHNLAVQALEVLV